VSRILEALGFERRRKMIGGRRAYFYAKAALADCPTAPLPHCDRDESRGGEPHA
jgi:hypothetical protein